MKTPDLNEFDSSILIIAIQSFKGKSPFPADALYSHAVYRHLSCRIAYLLYLKEFKAAVKLCKVRVASTLLGSLVTLLKNKRTALFSPYGCPF